VVKEWPPLMERETEYEPKAVVTGDVQFTVVGETKVHVVVRVKLG
jgi:hypothetical protein